MRTSGTWATATVESTNAVGTYVHAATVGNQIFATFYDSTDNDVHFLRVCP